MNAFFIGIGGMGMSGLAKILHARGCKVAGSDRDLNGVYCKHLEELGIKLYPQDGTGVESFMNDCSLSASEFVVVKSTAVESTVPDVVAAGRLGVEQIMRSDLLAAMFNAKIGVAVGGTAGKTTTTGLIAWILKKTSMDPTCAVGGIISGLDTNAFNGDGKHFIIEADESDGSIVKYRPWLSLVTNVTRDHKPLTELQELFTTFLNNTTGFRLVCYEDRGSLMLKKTSNNAVITYGFDRRADWCAKNVHIRADESFFTVFDTKFSINLPGEHNILNALGAIVASYYCGLSLDDISMALSEFKGMKRRFEKVGVKNGVTVIDDFAHNPAEIAAAISTARRTSKRRFIVYQPHGFGPTSFTKDDLVEVFSGLYQDEFLFLDDIYYGGGTVEKNISSFELANEISKRFKNVCNISDRELLIDTIAQKAAPGDIVLVMGARDINSICPKILERIPEQTA